MLISKPGIVAGLAAAALAGMTLANKGFPPVEATLSCLACLGLAATGSAMLNVLLEARTDAVMPRVTRRVAALARLGRKKTLAAAILMITASLVLSFVYINAVSAILILAATVSYTVLYTLFLKRRSPYGTVPGGLPGALPVLIGYASVKPAIGLDGLILFLVMLLWQPPHFLALALKYREQYKAAGLPVMPVSLGVPYTKTFLVIYAAALPPLTLALWAFGYCSVYFAAFATALGVLFLGACYVDIVRLGRYGRAFGASIVYIIALLAAVVVDVSARGV